MAVEVTSTTDSKEAVTHAMGLAEKKEEPAPKEEAAPVENEASEESEENETDSEEETETTEETPEEEETEESDTSEEDEENEEEEVEEKPKRKRTGGYKRRVQKLTKKLSAAEQEAEYWRNEALKKAGKNSGKEDENSLDDSFQDTGRPNADNFETQEEYIEALTEWKVERQIAKKEASQKVESQQKALEEKAAKLQKEVAEFALEHEDFEDLLEDVNDIPVSPAMQEAILESENGPLLMYELAKRPEEYERLNAMSGPRMARAIGRFEAKYLEKGESSPRPKKTKMKTKPAPKPIQPVGGKASPSTKSPDEMSFKEFKAWREQNRRI